MMTPNDGAALCPWRIFGWMMRLWTDDHTFKWQLQESNVDTQGMNKWISKQMKFNCA